jgi:hypothetical protein
LASNKGAVLKRESEGSRREGEPSFSSPSSHPPRAPRAGGPRLAAATASFSLSFPPRARSADRHSRASLLSRTSSIREEAERSLCLSPPSFLSSTLRSIIEQQESGALPRGRVRKGEEKVAFFWGQPDSIPCAGGRELYYYSYYTAVELARAAN